MSAAEDKSGVVALPDHQMTEVTKDFFFDGMVLPVPVYLRLSPGNYLLVGKKGDRAQIKDLHAFSSPVSRAYVKTIDHNYLISQVTEITSKVVGQKTVPDAIKAKFLSGLTTDVLSSFEASGFASVEQLKKVSNIVVDLNKNLAVFDEIMGLLMALPEGESRHAMTTCLISLAICKEMEISIPAVLEKVAMGALLHDVGMKTVPKHIFDRPRHLWSAEDLQAYEQHPIKGVEMLRDIRDIPQEVLLIVAEHHENSQGLGFPKKLRDVKISPLGKIVILGNYFASLMFAPSESGKNYTADEAIHYIDEILGQPFNKQVFLALKKVVNEKALIDKKKKE